MNSLWTDTDLYIIFALLFAWGSVFMVPVSMTAHRRSKKKPVYWHLVIVAIIFEAIILITTMSVLHIIFEHVRYSGLLPPLFGAITSGIIYWNLANIKDKQSQKTS